MTDIHKLVEISNCDPRDVDCLYSCLSRILPTWQSKCHCIAPSEVVRCTREWVIANLQVDPENVEAVVAAITPERGWCYYCEVEN